MNIEKIEKLIESPNIDDKKLGLSFLLEQLGEEGFKDYFENKVIKGDIEEWRLLIDTPNYTIYRTIRSSTGTGTIFQTSSTNRTGWAGKYKIDLR